MGSLTADVDNPQLDAAYRGTIAQWNQRIHILEAFNGRHFFSLPSEAQAGGGAVCVYVWGGLLEAANDEAWTRAA